MLNDKVPTRQFAIKNSDAVLIWLFQFEIAELAFCIIFIFSRMATQKFLTFPGGKKVPTIGMGSYGFASDAEIEKSFDEALELGYRFIDTAIVYKSEKAIGNVLKRWFSSGKLKRDDIFIITKLPMVGVHPDRVQYFMKKSLENLQLDYVDLYLVHFPVGCKYENENLNPQFDENGIVKAEPKTDHVAVWRKMEEQVEAGRTKNIGLSNYSIEQIKTILNVAKIKPVAEEIEVSVYLQQHELVNFCQKNNLNVIAYTPLAKAGDMLKDPVINKIAKKHSKTPAQIALRFLTERNIAAVPKSEISQFTKENINIYDFKLDDDDMKALYALDKGEEARICYFEDFFKGISKHPDYPFPRTH